MRRVSVQHVECPGRRALPVKNRALASGGQKEKGSVGLPSHNDPDAVESAVRSDW